MKKLTAVGGDVFAGFFSLGVRRAGFEVPFHLEHCNYGSKTCKLNFPETEVLIGREAWDLERVKKAGPIHLMFTNPPCASFSSAGMSRCGRCNDLKSKWSADDRTQWSVHLAEAGRELGVAAWIWESVTNAWDHGRAFCDDHAREWQKAGYAVTVVLQNNMHLGAPQNRKRMLFVAHKKPLVFPPLTKAAPPTGEILRKVRREVGEMTPTDGPPMSRRAGYERLWHLSTHMKNYANFHAIYQKMSPEEREGIHPKPGFACKTLHPDRPSPVLNELVVHPYEPRMLSTLEIRRLSGIPDDWKFSGGYNASALEMARTVLPPVGEWIATAVRDGITKAWPKQGKTYRLYDCRSGEAREEVLQWP